MKPWRRVSGFLPSIKQYIRSTPLQYSTAKWRTLKRHAAAIELANAEKREENHGEEEDHGARRDARYCDVSMCNDEGISY